ncbi:50S ribosomal protein L15 [endosymbiont of Euscepes postfasciatus]|uniref:50S ribosomal protein L15 n=1 Tax=endosymbiont of Euscepes postfasciatus TaxID=650377 RepID=UPI000DC72BFC|nr:50S ribosomal protein L15 [endosymbiont of Euscepes postfasciatus]BBA84675.1 50S ribosomal protein L15 [endosymbiont of Euscepes postfasciatus]
MKLNNIKCSKGSKKKKKRICRGISSGYGKTGGRGHKGQKSRSGSKIRINFEGGQTPFYRKVPKYGFKNNINKNIYKKTLTTNDIKKIHSNIINLDILKENKLINKSIKEVKIILKDKIINPISIIGLKLSNGVINNIKLIGGKIE